MPENNLKHPLHDAVLRDDEVEVARLLEAGANPNTLDKNLTCNT